jgi:hypothetical protein
MGTDSSIQGKGYSRTTKLFGVLLILFVPFAVYESINSPITGSSQPDAWQQHGGIAVASVKIWRNNLKDPDSAKIRSAALMPSGAWCIDLGAKNGFGAYVRNYILISPNGAPQFADSLGGSSDFGAAWNSYCDGTGKEYANVVQASI